MGINSPRPSIVCAIIRVTYPSGILNRVKYPRRPTPSTVSGIIRFA